jgi:hypothetical protein
MCHLATFSTPQKPQNFVHSILKALFIHNNYSDIKQFQFIKSRRELLKLQTQAVVLTRHFSVDMKDRNYLFI